jgi:hypothetical protein
MYKILTIIIQLTVLGCGVSQTSPQPQPVTDPTTANTSLKDEATTRATAQTSIWVGKTGSGSLHWTTEDLTLANEDEKLIFSLRHETELLFQLLQRNAGSVKSCTYVRDVKLRSIVGDLVTIEDHTIFDYSFAPNDKELSGPQSETSRLVTVGARHAVAKPGELKAIRLEELFDSKEIYEQLLNDEAVSHAIKEKFGDGVALNFASFQKRIRGDGSLAFDNYRYVIYPDFTTNFVFESVRGDRLTVKLIFPSAHRTDRTSYETVLTLTVPANLMEDFSRASDRSLGFLSSEAASRFMDSSTRLEYRCA